MNKNHLDALRLYNKALEIKPNDIDSEVNKISTLLDLKKFDAADQLAEKVLSIDPSIAIVWCSRGIALNNLKSYDLAVNAYEHAIRINPMYYEAWSNQSLPLHALNRSEDALRSCLKALEINPNYAEAWFNKALLLHKLNKCDDALAAYDRAIQIHPNYDDAWMSLGEMLADLKLYTKALTAFQRALEINPKLEFLYGTLTQTELHICKWDNYYLRKEVISKGLSNGEKIVQPLTALSLFDDEKKQLQAAKIFSELSKSDFSDPILQKRVGNKIRVAYISPDFKLHPLSYLTAGLFESHDRTQFEIIGVSLKSSDARDQMRRRLIGAFDEFYEIEDKPNEAKINILRNLKIDIAVDMCGHTKSAQTYIFSSRISPIQINYLGYPGTMGHPSIDYMIADHILVPCSSASNYSEKIIYMPHSFQVNDSKRYFSNHALSRAEYGLPEEGFIFCCFNNSYKISPDVFDGWMRILSRVKKSILWLIGGVPEVIDNLHRQAILRGINPDRVIFAGVLDYREYLDRYRIADLFIDTLPFNAGTTASDALWSGLPVLTQTGKSYAGRMASSLLTALDLKMLITENQADYENQAVTLAENPKLLLDIKKSLLESKKKSTLFNTNLFASLLEKVYFEVYERHKKGLLPGHLRVAN